MEKCDLCRSNIPDLTRFLIEEAGCSTEFGTFLDTKTSSRASIFRGETDPEKTYLRLSRSFGELNSGADISLSVEISHCPHCGRDLGIGETTNE